METSRLQRLLLGLVLGIATTQLRAAAEDSPTVTSLPEANSALEAGEGVRPVEHAEPVTPKERPRLPDNEVVSLKRRLEVHGGMSFTYGWASGGRNFREVGVWTSYFDPESGLGLAVGFSRFSGDVPYGYGYGYDGYGYGRGGGYYGSPRSAYDINLFLVRPNFSLDVGFSQTEFSPPSFFDGSGSSLHGPKGRRF